MNISEVTRTMRPLPSTQSKPQMFTLAGKELLCFQAGEQIGIANALTAAADDTRKYEAHIAAQLAALQKAILEDPTYLLPVAHPMKPAIEALTTLAEPIEQHAANMVVRASAMQTQGNQIMGRVAAMETAREAAWRPPFRAWAMLALALIPAVTVATVVSTLAARLGWW